MRGIINATQQGMYDISATPNFELGTEWLPDGDKGPVLVYAKAGGTALAAGKVNTSAAADSNFTAIAVQAAAAIGDKIVYVTAGGSCTAGEYEQGDLEIYDVAGYGYNYKIKRHETMTAGGTMTIELERPLKIALTTSSTVTVKRNPYMATVVAATTIAGACVGVCPTVVTAAYYYWLIKEGKNVNVLCQGTPALGNMVVPSGSVAGALAIYAGSGTLPILGVTAQVGVDGKYTAFNVKF